MKRLALLSYLLLIGVLIGDAQVQRVRGRILEEEVLIRGEAPSTRALDNYMMAYEAIGDADLSHILILRSMLTSNLSTAIDTVWNQLPVLHDRGSIDLRALSKDPRGIPWSAFIHLLTMTARIEETRHVKAFLTVSGRLRSTCPHIPISNEPIRDRINYELTNSIRFARWAVRFPDEWQTFLSVFRETYATWCEHEQETPHRIVSEHHRLQMKDHMVQSFYGIYYPLGIERIRTMSTATMGDLPSGDLLEEDPKAFVQEAFTQLLGREPTPEEANRLTSYLITFEEKVTPEMVFLAILQSNK